ncbi:MAG: single-stranded DNA-binding protein [Halanaerobiales bacterium]|nr:single-stranded DNA-binding protein [Halanaerobiales bacterium]
MNKSFLVGRLTKDPELRYTKANDPVCNFTLAVNRDFTNAQGEREADFITIVVWKKAGENVKKYLGKGSQVAIDGRIETSRKDNEKGETIYYTKVIANRVQFLDSKPQEEKQEEKEEPKEETNPFEEFGSSVDIDDSDLPF